MFGLIAFCGPLAVVQAGQSEAADCSVATLAAADSNQLPGSASLKYLLLNIGEKHIGQSTKPNCQEGKVAGVDVTLAAGLETGVTLVLVHRLSEEIRLDLEPSIEGDDSYEHWLTVHTPAGAIRAGQPAPVVLSLHAPADLAHRTVRRAELVFSLDDGHERVELSVVIALEVLSDESMFRDHFRIDTVPGQFSFNSLGWKDSVAQLYRPHAIDP
jgi:hypothetical protein